MLAGVLLRPSDVDASSHSADRSFSQSWAPPGGRLVVTITATDFGGFGLVRETLPEGFSYSGSSLSDVSVTVDGQTASFVLLGDRSFTYTADAPDVEGTYTFTGVVKDADKDERPSAGIRWSGLARRTLRQPPSWRGAPSNTDTRPRCPSPHPRQPLRRHQRQPTPPPQRRTLRRRSSLALPPLLRNPREHRMAPSSSLEPPRRESCCCSPASWPGTYSAEEGPSKSRTRGAGLTSPFLLCRHAKMSQSREARGSCCGCERGCKTGQGLRGRPFQRRKDQQRRVRRNRASRRPVLGSNGRILAAMGPRGAGDHYSGAERSEALLQSHSHRQPASHCYISQRSHPAGRQVSQDRWKGTFWTLTCSSC